MGAARSHPDLAFRIDSLAAADKRAAWAALLRDVFDLDFDEYSRLGVWNDGFRAFSWMDGEVIAANVGLRPLPLVVGGRRVAAGQIHAVATRPAYRRRGLFRDLMRRALEQADAQFECLLLYTETPDLYRPFGFRPLPEHRFRGRLDLRGGPEARPRVLDLSIRDGKDRATILYLFAGRRPVSDHLGLADNGDIFVANALWQSGWRLSFLPDEDALVVWDCVNGVARLHDIVASRLPSAAALAATMELACAPDGHSPEIEVLFPPDLLAGAFAPIPHAGEILCVRGPFAIEGTPFMLPLTAMS